MQNFGTMSVFQQWEVFVKSAKNKVELDIAVEAQYIAEESLPEQKQYVFAYTITITNKGLEPTTVLRRHWFITNSDGKIYEIEGEGVLDQQPDIYPGESFSYTSGTVLDTPAGTMKRSYQVLDEHGKKSEVTIPAFTLAVPKKLH